MALSEPTVLVLRALGLGDALTGVPALRALRRAFPASPLLLAADGPPARLLRCAGLVDGVVPTPNLDARSPGQRLGRHVAVNLHGRGPVSHRLLQAGNPERLIAFACPDVGVGGPPWREPERSEPEHEAHRWCRLVASELAVPADPGDLRLGTAISSSTTCDVRRGPVVVHPGAASIGRRWPAERFASVARSLAWGFAASEPGAGRVVLTGSAEEAALCRRVADQAGLDPRADLAGSLDLARLCRLLATARLLVCGDTGVAHLATALGTPSVLLFGPTPPGLWGPLIDLDRHRVLWRPDPGDDRGDPHTDDLDPALARITMEEVLAEASSLLFRMRPGHDRTR